MNVQEVAKTLAEATALELNELKTELREKYGFEPVGAVVATVENTETAEKADYTVTLADPGAQKVAVIKAVKEITGLGLGEAKAIVDTAPSQVIEHVSKDEADKAKSTLESAGAVVEVS